MLQPTENHIAAIQDSGLNVKCNLHTYAHLTKDLLLYLSGHGHSFLQAQQNKHILMTST